MTAPLVSGKHRDDRLRPEPPDGAHRVLEQHFPRPARERLLQRAGVAKVVGAGEILAGPFDPPRRLELAGADDAELDPELGANQVLAALAARQGQVGRLPGQTTPHPGEKGVVFVVGMRSDEQQPPVGRELRQGEVDHLETPRSRRCQDVRRRRHGLPGGPRRGR